LDVLGDTGLALDWQVIGYMIFLGGIGSILGKHISNKVPQKELKMVFGIFLIIMAIYILTKSLPQLI
jgi:uncharacterized membrane protein YfcA